MRAARGPEKGTKGGQGSRRWRPSPAPPPCSLHRFFVGELPAQTRDAYFYRAILAINEGLFAEAHEHICAARAILDVTLTALIAEGYDRAFKQVVQVQILTEMEEVIRYKMEPDQRASIRHTWTKRLLGTVSPAG